MIINWIKSLLHHEQTTKKEKMVSGILFFGYIFILGYAGNQWNPTTRAFYDSLVKPEITPPNWTFSVVWLILFTCIALSGYYAWNHYEDEQKRKLFTLLYGLNGLLAFGWSYTFFGLQMIDKALYVIIGLIIVIELMILTAFKVNQKSAYLLLPYLGWVLFATYLNTAFVILNG